MFGKIHFQLISTKGWFALTGSFHCVLSTDLNRYSRFNNPQDWSQAWSGDKFQFSLRQPYLLEITWILGGSNLAEIVTKTKACIIFFPTDFKYNLVLSMKYSTYNTNRAWRMLKKKENPKIFSLPELTGSKTSGAEVVSPSSFTAFTYIFMS